MFCAEIQFIEGDKIGLERTKKKYHKSFKFYSVPDY